MLIADFEPSLSFVCGLLAIVPSLLLFLFFRDDLAGGIEKTFL
jgi:hypothetical protein